MSLKKVHDNQPETFEFTEKNLSLANEIFAKYIFEMTYSNCLIPPDFIA